MAITHAKNEYTIPRGRVYFEAINPATDESQGAIYMGNCPAFNVSIETEKAEHYSSETGLREKDASVVLEVKRSGSITCDNMNATNVALFLSGSTGAIEQTAETVTGEVLAVLPGRYFQLGATAANPVGARKVSNVVVKSGDGSTHLDGHPQRCIGRAARLSARRFRQCHRRKPRFLLPAGEPRAHWRAARHCRGHGFLKHEL